LTFSLDRLNANTFDFHRVLQYANEQDLGTEFFSAVQNPFFAGVINPFDPDVLVQAAASVGLDGERVRQVLANDEYSGAAHADRSEGMALGLSGVPFVVFDRVIAAPGAQSVEVYAQILDQIVGQVAPEAVSQAVAHG
jgi:predicted DsbA family dithiol-disulfide isomerase